MQNTKEQSKKDGGRTMTVKEAKELTFERFLELDKAYGGFEIENTKNHPIRDEDETFMEFIKRGSEKIKSDPTIKKILE